MVAEAWHERAAIIPIGSRQILKLAAYTRLGWSWYLIRPLIPIASMLLIFGGVLKVGPTGVPYIIFLLPGMLAWSTFDETIYWATRSFQSPRRLLRTIRVSPLVMPLSGAVHAVISATVTTVILIGASLAYGLGEGHWGIALGWQTLEVVPGLALAVLLGWAFGFWLCVFNLWAPDVRLALRTVLGFWLYLTPVIYAPSHLSGVIRELAALNPVAPVVTMVRYGLLGEGGGGGNVDVAALAYSIGVTAVVFVTGLVFFNRNWSTVLRGFSIAKPDPDADDDDEV